MNLITNVQTQEDTKLVYLIPSIGFLNMYSINNNTTTIGNIIANKRSVGFIPVPTTFPCASNLLISIILGEEGAKVLTGLEVEPGVGVV